MEFRPPKRWAGAAVGAALVVVMSALSFLLVWRILHEAPSFVVFAAASVAVLLLALVCLFAFWTYCCLTLTYTLDRNRLAIRWGPTRHFVPLSLVEALVPGVAVAKSEGIKGINWPWCHVGSSRVPDIGNVLFFSAHRSPQDVLFVVTPSLAYGISVESPVEFAQELELRRRLGATSEVSLRVQGSAVLSLPIWSDRRVQLLLLVGLVVNLFVFAYLYYVLPAHPNLTLVQLTPTGAKEALGWKWQALLPPALALMVSVVNLVIGVALYSKERVAAYLSIAAGLLLQLIISVAVFKAVL